MIKPIVKDAMFLAQKSAPAEKEDLPAVQDLMDTFQVRSKECVGMAANMIGIRKRILIVDTGFMPLVMINPRIISKMYPYEAEEGCLSLSGTKKTTRYAKITVSWQDTRFHRQQKTFEGLTAQTIQHEMDHFEGILI